MIGALVGAGLSIASSIAGGIANRKAAKRQERMLAQQKKENEAWYNRRYNEDPAKRADTVRLLTQMQEQIKNRNTAAKGRQAVMGGTEDSTTAVKEANNKTIADTTSQIVAANENRKDSIEQQYMNRRQQLQNQQIQMDADKAGNTANAVAGVAGTAANIASALDSGDAGKDRSDKDSGEDNSSGDGNNSVKIDKNGRTDSGLVFTVDNSGNYHDQYGNEFGRLNTDKDGYITDSFNQTYGKIKA